MGRHKKPSALEALQGNPGKRPANKLEPMPEMVSEGLKPPASLDGMPVAQQAWTRVLGIVCRMQVATEADLPMLELYCKAVADEAHAEEMLLECGLVQTAASGHSNISGWYSVRKQARAEQMKILGLFGMSPSDRAKVSMVGQQAEKNVYDM